MSDFTDVDASRDPEALITALDRYAAGLAAMKAYVAAAAARAVPRGRVLDLGCGAGHDLLRMATAGLQPLGVDPSAAMVRASRDRLGDGAADLVRADGRALPFRGGSLDGCRIERVLQHVVEPRAVLAEAARVVRAGGFLAVFEPDWTSIRFEPTLPGVALEALVTDVRHPDVGARLADLVAAAGFAIDDQVTERSWTERLGGVPWPLEHRLRRAAREGELDADLARRAVLELRAHDDAGRFRATWTKVLVVATRR